MPRLCEPVIRIGLADSGSKSTTLLCTIATACGSFFSSCTNQLVALSIAAGSTTSKSACITLSGSKIGTLVLLVGIPQSYGECLSFEEPYFDPDEFALARRLDHVLDFVTLGRKER